MSRINTNISSLLAQTALANSQQQLQTSLTQLSTGFQINTGADNPAGLIASQVLQTNITGANAAISNSQTADQLIATADSALGQISSLLDDINGLVSNSANTGALSASQIAANQLQVDSSLQAIDQIAQTTSFGGENLLNGSLNFLTTSAGNALTAASGTFGSQAANAEATGNFAASPDSTLTLAGDVTASGGSVTFTAATPGAGANGYNISYVVGSGGSGTAASAAIDTSGKTLTITVNSGATAASVVAAVAANTAAAAVFNAVAATRRHNLHCHGLCRRDGDQRHDGRWWQRHDRLVGDECRHGLQRRECRDQQQCRLGGRHQRVYSTTSNTLTLSTTTSTTANQIINKINATGVFSASTTGDGTSTLAASTFSAVTSGGAESNQIEITAVNGGTAYNGVSVVLTSGAAAGHETATYTTSSKTLTITANVNSTTTDLVDAINATGLFSAAPTVSGAAGSYAFATTTDVTTGGAAAGNAIGNLQINQANFGTAIVARRAGGCHPAGRAGQFGLLRRSLGFGHGAASRWSKRLSSAESRGRHDDQPDRLGHQSVERFDGHFSVGQRNAAYACLHGVWLECLRVGPGVERLVRHSYDQRHRRTPTPPAPTEPTRPRRSTARKRPAAVWICR